MTHPNKRFPVALVADFDRVRARQALEAALPVGEPDDLIEVPRSVVEAFLMTAQESLCWASVYADAFMKHQMTRPAFDARLEPKLAEMGPTSRHLLDVLEHAGLVVLCNTAQDAALVNLGGVRVRPRAVDAA